MLKTIRFKSSLCQKLEADLRDKEEEIINAKSENFRLIKTVEMLQKSHQNHQKELESAEKIHNTNFEARLEHLEQIFTENKTTESGYLSLPSIDSTNPKPLLHEFLDVNV